MGGSGDAAQSVELVMAQADELAPDGHPFEGAFGHLVDETEADPVFFAALGLWADRVSAMHVGGLDG